MVESVDTKDLKSFGYCSCAGSSPASGTKQHSPAPHRSIRGCVRPNFVEVGTKQHSPAPQFYSQLRAFKSRNRYQTTFSSTAQVVIAVAGCVLAPGIKQRNSQHRAGHKCYCRLCSCSSRKIRIFQHRAGRNCCCRLCSCSRRKTTHFPAPRRP